MSTLAPRPTIDPAVIRSQFPALSSDTVFLENAGGSQVPSVVADAIHRYMLESYVQLGAGYAEADRADAVIADAHAFVHTLMHGAPDGIVTLGPSTSQLCLMLAQAYGAILQPGDEVIVAETGHEANVGPWVKLAERGITVRTWRVDPESYESRLDDLATLLNERTRLVALVHVSNLLGSIVDVEAVTRLVHEAGARVVVDGVAYAPHRAIDVMAWDVDWYVYSAYKVYGPHMAALYGKADAVAEITGPNHYFIGDNDVPYKLELGGVNHEGCAGVVALGSYLHGLAGLDAGQTLDRAGVEKAFGLMADLEQPGSERLLEYLRGAGAYRIIGRETMDERRVGTISFVHATKTSQEIAAAANAERIGIRHGHMYAHRLCTALGLEPEDGVVRVSLVHYNTVDEIERLIDVLQRVA